MLFRVSCREAIIVCLLVQIYVPVITVVYVITGMISTEDFGSGQYQAVSAT